MKKLLILFLCTQLITSCDEKDEIKLKELPGTWVWTSSCGGYSGQCSYPDKVHKMYIKITDDTFTQMTDGQITIDTTYEINKMEISESNYPFDKIYEFKLDDGQILNIRFVQNKDVIYLADNYWFYSYKRLR